MLAAEEGFSVGHPYPCITSIEKISVRANSLFNVHNFLFTGEVQIALTNAQGQDIPIDIQDNRDGTFTVEYSTPSPGDHRVTVLYAGSEIPQSPIVVPVQPHVDVTKVKVDGLEPSEYFMIS